MSAVTQFLPPPQKKDPTTGMSYLLLCMGHVMTYVRCASPHVGCLQPLVAARAEVLDFNGRPGTLRSALETHPYPFVGHIHGLIC